MARIQAVTLSERSVLRTVITAVLTAALILLSVPSAFAQTADTQSPSMPGSFTATAASATQVNLSWTASTDNVGVSGYKIYKESALLVSVASSTLSYSDTSAVAATTYHYYVCAYDAANNFSCTPAATVSTPSTTSGTPAAPSSVSASQSGTSILVTWPAVSDSSPSNVAYNIYISANSGSYNWTGQTAGASSTSYTWSYPTSGSSYRFRVEACKSGYGCSSQTESNPVTFSSGSGGGLPAAPSALVGNLSGANVYLTWVDNSSNETEFKIYDRIQPATTWNYLSMVGVNITNYTHSGPPSGTHEYYVVACTSSGCSGTSNTIVVTVGGSSGSSCTGLILTFTNNQTSYAVGESVNYTWTCTPGGNASSVTVQVVNSAGTATTYNSFSGSAPTMSLGFSTSNLAVGSYTLRACFTSNCSPVTISQVFTVTSSASVPLTPVNLSAVIANNAGSNSTFNLTWGGTTSNITSFRVFQHLQGTTWPTTYDTRDTSQIMSSTQTTLTVQVAVLWNGYGTYEFKVQACNSLGCSGYSNFATIAIASSGGTIPTAPSNFRLAGPVTSSTIPLAWNDNSTNEDKFNIDRKLTTSSIYTSLVQLTTANTTAYTDAGLPSGTAYDYRVQACLSNTGCSDYSYLTGVSTSGTTDATAPSTPAVPALSIISANQINLSWPASTDNVGVAGYKVYRCVCGNTASMVYLTSVTSNSYADTGLAASTSYTYAISAYDTVGNISPQGPAASGTTYAGTTTADLTAPSVPTNLAVSAAVNNQLNLSWTASTDNLGVAGYKVYRNGTYVTTAIANTFVDTGLAASTYYSYYLAAVDAAGNQSANSTTISMTTLSGTTTDVTAPVIVGVRAENIIISGAQIKWSTNESANAKVEYGTLAGNYPLNSIAECFTASLVIDHCVNLTGLTVGTRYYYRVRSADAVGLFVYSPEYSFIAGDSGSSTTTPPTATGIPETPANLRLDPAPTATAIYLKWDDKSYNETKFAIERTLTGTGGWTFLGFVGSNVTAYTDGNIMATNKYDYRVQACTDGYGCSGYIYLYNVSSTGTVANQPAPVVQGWGASVGTNGLSTVGAGFNTEMDRSTFTPQNIFLHRATDPQTVTVPGTMQVSDYYVNLISSSPLIAGVEYISVIKKEVKNKAGVGLAADYTCKFTAQSTGYYASCPLGATTGYKATLTGTITDSTGKAIGNVGVQLFTKDFSMSFGGSTISDGSYLINLAAGTYMLELFPPATRTDLIKPPLQTVTVKDGEVTRFNFQFGLVSTSNKVITGTIKFNNGQPVVDAQVGAYNETTNYWVDTFADLQGNYKLSVSSGKFKVSLRPRDPTIAKWQWPGTFQDLEFTGDTAETKVLNFTVPVADTKVTVKAVDENGLPLATAGIMLEVVGTPPQYRRTEADGKASFQVAPGSYTIRGYLPPEQGFINPEPQIIIVAKAEQKEVTLKFGKLKADTSINISGKALFENGSPAGNAFIWAWTELGGNAYTRTNEKGEFSLTVSQKGFWRLGAGQEVDGFPYKSAEISINTEYKTADILLTLVKYSTFALPKPVEVVKAVTETIVAQASDGAQVVVPPNAAGSSGTVNVAMTPTVEVPSTANAKVVGTVWNVDIKNQIGSNVTQFTNAIEITFPYDEAKLKADGVAADVLKPNYYDDATGAWVEVTDYTIDKDSKSFILRVKHLTRFALVAPADITPPTAVVSLASKVANNEVTLSWTNPAADFHHVKVYRSETSNGAGELLSDQVTANSFKDSKVVAGKTYYYYLESVDAAGNVSKSSDRLKVTASGNQTTTAAKVTFSKDLGKSSKGNQVAALQQKLQSLGYYPASAQITSVYDANTVAAVKAFQKANKLKQVGTLGPFTRKALNKL